MKNSYRNIQIIKYLLSRDKSKMLYIIGIIIAFYGSVVLGVQNDNYFEAPLISLTFPIFNIIVFSIMCFNTVNTISTFEKEFSFYIIRLENKKNYIKKIILNTLIINTIYILGFFILYFLFLLIFRSNTFTIASDYVYRISNMSYLIYYLIRYILFILLINILTTLLYINFKQIITFAFNFIVLIGFMIFATDFSLKTKIDLNFWSYFSIERFKFFKLDLISTSIVILILLVIITIVYNLTKRNKKLVIT